MITITYMCLHCFSDAKIEYRKEKDFSLNDEKFFENLAPDKCIKCGREIGKKDYSYSIYDPGLGYAPTEDELKG